MDIESKYDRGKPVSSVNPSDAQKLLAPFLNGRSIDFMKPLSGGYLNTNYEMGVGGISYVLRISNRNHGALANEVSILRNLERTIPAPRVVYFEHHGEAESGQPQFAVLRYLSGKPLYLVEDEFTPSDVRKVGSEIGEALATIHRTTFRGSGDFDSNFNVQGGMDDFAVAIRYETNRCLNSKNLKARLSEREQEEVAHFIEENVSLLDSLVQARLTHSDFNQKNILVDMVNGRWTVTGIIDWEYAFSGPFLYDLGNFLRFEEEMPAYRDHLIASYKQRGGTLSENWRKVARYLDLLPQLQFLAMDVETPKTFETAKSVLRKTMAEWTIT